MVSQAKYCRVLKIRAKIEVSVAAWRGVVAAPPWFGPPPLVALSSLTPGVQLEDAVAANELEI